MPKEILDIDLLLLFLGREMGGDEDVLPLSYVHCLVLGFQVVKIVLDIADIGWPGELFPCASVVDHLLPNKDGRCGL